MSDEIVLTPKYWDCECAENYIHPRRVSSCAICKSRRVEQPQSRVNEVLAHGLPLKQVRRTTTRAVDLPNESRQPSWCDDGLDDAVIGSLP